MSIRPSKLNSRFRLLLERIQKQTGHTKARIAENLGVDRAALTHLASGRSKTPSRQTLALLKERYGVNEDWVLTGSEPMFYGILGVWHEPDRFGPPAEFLQPDLPQWLADPFAGDHVGVDAMRQLSAIMLRQLGENSRAIQKLTRELELHRREVVKLRKEDK